MGTDGYKPNWQRELESFKGIKSTFIIEGNISDIYPYDSGDGKIEFYGIDRVIEEIFEQGATAKCYDFLFCDPLFGFTDRHTHDYTSALLSAFEGKAKQYNRSLREYNRKADREDPALSDIVRAALTMPGSEQPEERRAVAVTINLASRFLSDAAHLERDEISFFLNLFYASGNALRWKGNVNTLILIVDQFNNLPVWFYYNNPNVRTIAIPNPDRNVRNLYIDRYYTIFQDEDSEVQKKKEHFADITEGMKILELYEMSRIYDREKEQISDISEIVSIYKYGIKENKWLQMRGRITEDAKEKIKKRVKGQDQAIDKVISIIKRSVLGMSGMQHSSDSKPKGILFFAGPTGTGKTELVKTVTELLFGDERALLRFDMSEYREENSDQKLFGAPPGYIGYDMGGQLTNAVKSNPFSVLLFDEIDKAHPSIMDKFLQILEDGRMTDGRGDTVYFSETLIFFTSNVGISEEVMENGRRIRKYLVSPEDSYETICGKVKEAMNIYFKPEVLNRIGDNIVVFNFMDAESSRSIIYSKIAAINGNLEKRLKIKMAVTDGAYAWFCRECQKSEIRKYGGRGIGNVLEGFYVNPLAEFIFDYNCGEGDSLMADVKDDGIVFSMR